MRKNTYDFRCFYVIIKQRSTIQKANKIIVLDKGQIMEEGSHEELLKLDGFYANLYNMQYKEVLV